MPHEVYADGNEIAGKSGMNKVIASFPDVCLSPPSPPAGPVPIPYPNTSFSKDLKEGSTSVKLGGKPAALAQQSYYESSPLGDEAATRALGMGVINHSITGKTFFKAWSFDVKVEGKNVCRHLDLTTSNSMSDPANNNTPSPGTEATAAGAAAGPPTCGCCGGPAHSQAQAADNAMPASQWYAPRYPGTPPNRAEAYAIELTALIFEAARNEGCSDILPSSDPADPCGAHYAVSAAESRAAREDFAAQMSPLTPADYFRRRYGRKVGKKVRRQGEQNRKALAAGAPSIAHKSALSAGGCPIGRGNHAPVPNNRNCRNLEGMLGDVQGRIAGYHRRALGL